LSSDCRRLVTGNGDGTARLWEVVTGQEVHSFQGNNVCVTSVALSDEIKWLFTAGVDGTTRIWNVWGPDNSKEVCQLLSFRDGTWAVMDSEGRYDASNNADIEHLHWVVGMETFPLKQFKDRYYDPGLLAKHLGLHKERPREINAAPR
jgi:WD40 repeat protein